MRVIDIIFCRLLATGPMIAYETWIQC